jgi:hypothetical protein
MRKASLGRYGPLVIALLLTVQVLVLLASLGPLLKVSIFCTGPRSSVLAGLFGGIHLLFLGLLVLGLLSLRFSSLRLAYAALLVIGLGALPLQAMLVSNGDLQCDLP